MSVADAYAQIKNLENSGQITLPETKDTVVIGTIDPKAGTFTWSVPTLVQTTTLPPGPGQKTNTIINVTVGVVNTKAVDLLLKFAVIPQKAQAVNKQAARAATAAAPASKTASVGDVAGILGETNGGVTITGFPTVSSAPSQITVDAGLACSAAMQDARNVSPPVTTSSVMIDIPGKQPIYVRFFILRPPAVGLGAFTIPALPMTIVYAPPQGKMAMNTVDYSDTATVTRTVSSSITSSNDTKTVKAYSAADLVGKVASAITTVAAVVGTGGAGAAGGASVAGALSELGTALFGAAKDANDSTADATTQISSELSLVSGILGAVDSSTPTNSGTVTVENDHSLTLTVSNMSQYSSKTALGPGVGDRIVYMLNVKVVWMAVNGDVGIHILGFDKIGANAVQDLLQEEQSIANGGQPILELDAAAIKSLLQLDPLVTTNRTVFAHLGPPLVGPPRFVPADPPGRTGTGTGPDGDIFQASFDSSTNDKQTTTSTQTTITDAKPGWVSVLFGADNLETTSTATFTNSSSTDSQTDDKITSTITLFSEGLDDKYDVKIFYDCTFGTYLVVNSNSPALQGISTAGTLGTAVMAR
ncbi:MAG: hypothetical protein WBL65_09605 [Bryobacteraceae bacterium]